MSISFDRKHQRWRWHFDYTHAGKRHRSSRLLPVGWSKSQAQQYDRDETARAALIVVGQVRPSPSVERAIMQYLKDKSALKSFKTAAYHLASAMPHYVGRTFDELPEIAKGLGSEPHAAATNRQRIALVKAACRHAWKVHGWCDHDPTARMIMPVVNNARQQAPDRRAMLTLARATKHRIARQVIRILFYSGMRLGELWTGVVVGDLYTLPVTKSGRPRVVPLHPKIARSAARLLPLQEDKRNIQAIIQRARKQAGMLGIRIHDIRHGSATAMLAAGVPLNTVGNVLGHLDPRTTKRYEHLVTEPLTAAVATIGRRLA